MNEAGEAEGGGVGETVAEISTANEFGETKPEALLKDLGLDPDKYNLNEDDQPETPENEGKGEPDSEENDAQETEESSFLKMVNSLGAVRDGQPIEISSKEEVKNALQMYRITPLRLKRSRKRGKVLRLKRLPRHKSSRPQSKS